MAKMTWAVFSTHSVKLHNQISQAYLSDALPIQSSTANVGE